MFSKLAFSPPTVIPCIYKQHTQMIIQIVCYELRILEILKNMCSVCNNTVENVCVHMTWVKIFANVYHFLQEFSVISS